MRILITVKTYPTISKVHQDEFVCTAGFNEKGEWIRLYPIPFRRLDYVSQYKKYDWIEVDVKKHKTDWRPETYSPTKGEDSPINIVGHLDTKNNWEDRKAIVLKNVYTDLSALLEDAKENHNKTSLAVFKPTIVKDFIFSEESREWDEMKIGWLNQQSLFEDMTKRTVIKKLPYKFSYVFEDINGKSSTLMVEDWEIGQLFWNTLKHKQTEQIALQDVKNKYFNHFCNKTDLHFFLGTNFVQHTQKSRNPFIIIGLFYPLKVTKPNTTQLKLDFD